MVRKELQKCIGASFTIETKMVNDGLCVLQTIHEKEYHIIFIDAQMPYANGFLTTTMLRKYNYKGYIIGHTSVFSNEKEYFISCGANEVIEKPFNSKLIFEILTRVLRM